jgi:hypothetical protein
MTAFRQVVAPSSINEGATMKRVTSCVLIAAAAATLITGVLLSPAARAVTDSVFQYSTTQRGYFMIPAAALVPSNNTSQYGLQGGFKIITDSAAQVCFHAPINVPNGARLTALRTWYLRPTNTDVFFVGLRRITGPGALNIEYVAGDQNTQLPVRGNYGLGSTDIIDGMEIVDNQRYAYFLQYCIANDSEIYTTRIDYTYRNAGD